MPQPNPTPPTSSTPSAQAPEVRSLPLQTRLVPVATVDAEARTFETVWTTGAQVRRFDYMSWQPYIEELSLDPAHIRMGRLEAGAPLLNSHQQWDLRSVLGVTERAWMEPGEGRSVCRFSDRNDEVNAYWRDVVNGIIRNISVGYIVHRYEKIDPEVPGGLPIWRAIDWEPAEQSLVPVGADMLAGVRGMPGTLADVAGDATPELRRQLAEAYARSVGNRTYPCELVSRAAPAAAAQPAATSTPSPAPAARAADHPPLQQERHMPQQAQQTSGATTADNTTTTPAGTGITEAMRAQVVAEEQARIGHIRQAVATARRTAHGVAGLDEAFENSLVSRNLTLDQARAEIFGRLEQHSTSTGPARSAAALETVRDEQQQRRADMAAAVFHRANPSAQPAQLSDGARRYRGYSLFELARRSLEDQGLDTAGMSRNAIVSMAMGNSDDMGFRALHGTSDFTIALASTVTRSLRAGYEGSPRTFTRWARPGTLADFRAATRVAVAGNLTMEKVNQFGEFKRGKLVDSGENIQLATYGKVVGVTRQAVINDDLDFLARLPQMFGRAAAEFESDTVYGIVTANANMSDGVALFHANHGNLAGSGATISETTLSAARLAMRIQKDPSGNNQPLNLVGRFVLVPAALETAAQKQLAAVVVASSSSNTNVFQNSYEIVTEPRLDANSATAWYLVADSSQIDTVEYAYLEGEQGLYTEQRMGFDVDGLEVKARLDFAAKAIDHRGLYKNPGA